MSGKCLNINFFHYLLFWFFFFVWIYLSACLSVCPTSINSILFCIHSVLYKKNIIFYLFEFYFQSAIPYGLWVVLGGGVPVPVLVCVRVCTFQGPLKPTGMSKSIRRKTETETDLNYWIGI